MVGITANGDAVGPPTVPAVDAPPPPQAPSSAAIVLKRAAAAPRLIHLPVLPELLREVVVVTVVSSRIRLKNSGALKILKR